MLRVVRRLGNTELRAAQARQAPTSCTTRRIVLEDFLLFRSYTPAPPLDRFIENFWYQGYSSPHLKERILQDGTFKTVFNLQHDEFRVIL
jgi:hypothetical protein